MLDIIYFALQVTEGLLEFYIHNGLIHRDIKALNIMIDFTLGLIQIIDHGSVMYFN
jgi:serine/threonine protein kinase